MIETPPKIELQEMLDSLVTPPQEDIALLVDKINSRYDSTKTYSLGGSSDDTNRIRTEVDKINKELNEYARENPIEFQLISSYDKNFILLDKYIEEEKKKY